MIYIWGWLPKADLKRMPKWYGTRLLYRVPIVTILYDHDLHLRDFSERAERGGGWTCDESEACSQTMAIPLN